MDVRVKSERAVKTIRSDKELVRPGQVGLVLELVVRDKKGRVTGRRVMTSRSFVRGFLELLYVLMQGYAYQGPGQPYGITALWVLDKDDYLAPVIATHTFQHGVFRCNGGVGDTNMGIVVGTGTTPPNVNDNRLEAICPHGAAPGQLEYGAVTFGLPTSDPTTSHFTITRDFSNSSGAAITVNETGIYCLGMSVNYGGGYKHRYFMIIRDVISGGIAVPNGQTLTVNYREQATV